MHFPRRLPGLALLLAGCAAHSPRYAGRPCSDQEPCGGGLRCDSLARVCVEGGPGDGPRELSGADLAAPDRLLVTDLGSRSEPQACNAPHATGTLVNGACQYTCAAGWDNCNGTWSDGCEADLSQNGNCGACGKTCSARPHATASCSATGCKLVCTAPYQNCDGNDSNGCEIPVGVANTCDKKGLGGCGTAYCGSSSTTEAANFGTWTCVFCKQCHHYSDGWSWCLYLDPGDTGNFSSVRCATCCSSVWEDKVCPK
jgi:hypothetical protein